MLRKKCIDFENVFNFVEIVFLKMYFCRDLYVLLVIFIYEKFIWEIIFLNIIL